MLNWNSDQNRNIFEISGGKKLFYCFLFYSSYPLPCLYFIMTLYCYLIQAFYCYIPLFNHIASLNVLFFSFQMSTQSSANTLKVNPFGQIPADLFIFHLLLHTLFQLSTSVWKCISGRTPKLHFYAENAHRDLWEGLPLGALTVNLFVAK